MTTPPLFATPHLPGIGGLLKVAPEDFEVEEIPARAPSGRGRFAWLFVQKRGLSTPELVRRLGAATGSPIRLIGVAGYKDAQAVTRQWISLPATALGAAVAARIDGVKVLEVASDGLPLAPGDLTGNRFRVVVRGVVGAAAALDRARAVLAELEERGVPNFFGVQRFGVRGESPEIGRRLLVGDFAGALDLLLGAPSERENDPRARAFREAYERGDFAGARAGAPRALRLELAALDRLLAGASKEEAAKALPRRELRFFFSAWQALWFNRVLARRIATYDRALAGDLLAERDGAPGWKSADPTVDQRRVDAFELHPTGPLFGSRVRIASGEPGEIERALFAACEVPERRLVRPLGIALDGERRCLRFRAAAARAEVVAPDAVEFRFELPKGCFATTLVGEVMKTESPPA